MGFSCSFLFVLPTSLYLIVDLSGGRPLWLYYFTSPSLEYIYIYVYFFFTSQNVWMYCLLFPNSLSALLVKKSFYVAVTGLHEHRYVPSICTWAHEVLILKIQIQSKFQALWNALLACSISSACTLYKKNESKGRGSKLAPSHLAECFWSSWACSPLGWPNSAYTHIDLICVTISSTFINTIGCRKLSGEIDEGREQCMLPS